MQKYILKSYTAIIIVITLLGVVACNHWNHFRLNSNPFTLLDQYPSYIKFESRNLNPNEFFLIYGKKTDAIGEDIVIPYTPHNLISIFETLCLERTDIAFSEWEYQLILFYTPYQQDQSLQVEALYNTVDPVTILICDEGLLIDGVKYTVPNGRAGGISRLAYALYLSFCYFIYDN